MGPKPNTSFQEEGKSESRHEVRRGRYSADRGPAIFPYNSLVWFIFASLCFVAWSLAERTWAKLTLSVSLSDY